MSSRAYRIAPRRPAARRSRSRVDWERLGRISLVLILFVILALYINPVVNFVDAWRDSGAASRRSSPSSSRRTRSSAHVRETLEHSDAAELGARGLGMVNPDERSVVICEPGGPEACATSAP